MKINVRTAHGTVHALTVGREFKHYGMLRVNREGKAAGKADCGALTSSAAIVTDEAVTCPNCAKASN